MPWHPLTALSEQKSDLLLNFLYAGDAHFTRRSELRQEIELVLSALTPLHLVPVTGSASATTFDGNLAGSHTLADQEVGNSANTGFGQLLVGSVRPTLSGGNDNSVAVFRKLGTQRLLWYSAFSASRPSNLQGGIPRQTARRSSGQKFFSDNLRSRGPGLQQPGRIAST